MRCAPDTAQTSRRVIRQNCERKYDPVKMSAMGSSHCFFVKKPIYIKNDGWALSKKKYTILTSTNSAGTDNVNTGRISDSRWLIKSEDVKVRRMAQSIYRGKGNSTKQLAVWAYITHNSLSDPISWKFQWKYESYSLNFLYIRNKNSPDPEFYIFLGLGTNFVCYRYKTNLNMLCFTVKPQISSPGRCIFSIGPKVSEQQQLFLVLRCRDNYPRHCMRLMSRLADSLECLNCNKVDPTKK